MDIWTIVVGVGVVVGIIAGIVQVMDYLQKRRKKSAEPSEAAPSVPVLSAPLIPHNLPPRSEFIGREKEKARVHEALKSRSYLVSIDGIGGIGKTVLALQVAHECLRASKGEALTDGTATFNGFIWTTAKDRDLTLNTLLDAVARTLEYPGIAQQPVEEKRDAVRRLLQQKPYLLVVDNFETITDEGVRDFLLELPEPSKALITTREQKLRQVWAISLKGLAESEALALIRGMGKRLGLRALEDCEDRVLRHLSEATGGAPLAIKWAVGQIKQRGQSLDTVLAALHEARGSIFDSIFARSWELLSSDAKQVLTVMPLFAAAASLEAVEAASDVHHFALDEALGQLVEMSLMDATDDLDAMGRRYSIHPLTRSFAGARVSDDPTSEQGARLRLAGYYVKQCEEGGQWGNIEGFPWFEAELPNIIAVVEWANRVHRWDIVVSIFEHMFFFLGTRGYWQERIRLGQTAIGAAREAGERLRMAVFQHALAWILSRQGQYAEAERLLQSCIQLCTDLGQKREAVEAMITLAKIAVARGDLCRAQKVTGEATSVIGEAEYEEVAQGLLSVQARIELQSGNFETAHRLLLKALDVIQKRGLGIHAGSRQIDLGVVALAQNRLEEAESYFESGLKNSHDFLRQDNIAKAELGLARVHVIRGNRPDASRLALSAREQFVRMGMEQEASEADALLLQLGNSEDKDR